MNLAIILTGQLESSAMTPRDKNIKQILTDFIHQAHRADLKTSTYPKQWDGWTMKVSFGQGAPARVPWIAIISPDMSVSNGYYPVYLYYKDRRILILAFGISETNRHLASWPENILQDYQKIEKRLGKVPRYGDSLVFKEYRVDPEALEPFAAPEAMMADDLNGILRVYQDSVQKVLADPKSLLSQSMFYMEKQLEDFLIQNWDNTHLANDLELIFEDGENKSQQYSTGVGPIDILAKDKQSQSHTVIELKKGQTSDATIGQITRYMGWVKKHLHDPEVNGLIIAKGIDRKLRYAVEGLEGDSISLLTYNIDFQLNNFVHSG